MSEIKLKPCPFCGGKAEYLITENYNRCATQGWKFGIHCTKCMVALPMRDFTVTVDLTSDGELVSQKDEREKAADMWNRRVDDGM